MKDHIFDDRMQTWYNIFEYYAKAPLKDDNIDIADCKITNENSVFSIGKIGWVANLWRGIKIEAFSPNKNNIDDIYAKWIKYAKTVIEYPIYTANNNAHLFLEKLPQYFLHIAVVKTNENRVHIRMYAMSYDDEIIGHLSRILCNSYYWSHTKYPIWYYHDNCYTTDAIIKMLFQHNRTKICNHSKL